MVFLVLKGERDVPLTGVILVEFTDTTDKVHHVRLPAVQLQLVLVDAALVEYLVDQQHQALGITVDGLYIDLTLTLADKCLQLGKRSHDQSQRRADIMGGIDEELHLLLVHVLTGTTLQQQTYGSDDTERHQEIQAVGPTRAIPGRRHLQCDGLRL